MGATSGIPRARCHPWPPGILSGIVLNVNPDIYEEATVSSLEEREKGSNWSFPVYLALFVFSVGSLGVGFYLLRISEINSRVIRSIDVQGDFYFGPEEVVSMSGLVVGRVISDDAIRKAEQSLELHPVIKNARITRTDPDGLLIALRQRRCAAIVRTGIEEKNLYEVDDDLYIMSENRVRCTGVPLISGQFERSLDRFQDNSLFKLMAGWKKLRQRYPELVSRISEFRLRRGGGLTIFTTRRIRVEMSGTLDSRNIRRLYASFAFLEQEGRRTGIIDLRGADALFVPGY